MTNCGTCIWRKANHCSSVYVPGVDGKLMKNPYFRAWVPEKHSCKGWENANVSEVQINLGQER